MIRLFPCRFKPFTKENKFCQLHDYQGEGVDLGDGGEGVDGGDEGGEGV